MQWEQCFSEVCNSLFRIEISYGSASAWGTGFPIAKYKKPDKLALAIATAKHLLSFSDEDTVGWNIEQFDWRGNLRQKFSFKTNTKLKGKSPIRTHKEFDIGAVFMPNIAKIDQYKPLRTISISNAVIPGTRVGWAGFPQLAEYQTLRKQPCYFEGVISAIVDKGDRLYYIIDGHNLSGVSGGPVWCWNERDSSFDIIGIVCSYINLPNFPGLCVFESINPLMAYLSESNDLEMNSVV